MAKPILTTFLGLALCASTTAEAATPPPCIDPAEMRGMIAYFLPDVLGEVTRNCAAHLPADSHVRSGLPRLSAQLADGKLKSWPTAKAAFFKMSGPKDAETMAALPDDALRPLVDAAIASKMTIPLNASSCADVEAITAALAPLSAEQTVHLLATIFDVVARKDNKLRSCPRENKR